MAIAPLGRFVHERGRVLVHVSARAGCASAILPIAAVTASEGQMRTRFRGPRVDRHGLSVCTSHVPSHADARGRDFLRVRFGRLLVKVAKLRDNITRAPFPSTKKGGFRRDVQLF